MSDPSDPRTRLPYKTPPIDQGRPPKDRLYPLGLEMGRWLRGRAVAAELHHLGGQVDSVLARQLEACFLDLRNLRTEHHLPPQALDVAWTAVWRAAGPRIRTVLRGMAPMTQWHDTGLRLIPIIPYPPSQVTAQWMPWLGLSQGATCSAREHLSERAQTLTAQRLQDFYGGPNQENPGEAAEDDRFIPLGPEAHRTVPPGFDRPERQLWTQYAPLRSWEEMTWLCLHDLGLVTLGWSGDDAGHLRPPRCSARLPGGRILDDLSLEDEGSLHAPFQLWDSEVVQQHSMSALSRGVERLGNRRLERRIRARQYPQAHEDALIELAITLFPRGEDLDDLE